MALNSSLICAIVDDNIQEDKAISGYYGANKFERLCELLSFVLRVSHKILYDYEYGKLMDNGNWTGIIGLINRTEADVGVNEFFIEEHRMEAITFGYPTYIGDVTFVTKMPIHTSNIFAMFFTFKPVVWLLLLFTLILMITVKYYFLPEKGKYFSNIVFSILATCLDQPSSQKHQRASEFQFNMYCLIGVKIISSCYRSVLLSMIILPTLIGIRTIPELAEAVENGKYETMTYSGSVVPLLLSHSPSPESKSIGDSLMESRYRDGSIPQFLEHSCENIAFVEAQNNLKHLENHYLVPKGSLLFILGAQIFRRDFCCKVKLNAALRKIVESGLWQKLSDDEDYFASLQLLPRCKKGSARERLALSLIDLGSAFIIMGLGNLIALLVLILEILVKKM